MLPVQTSQLALTNGFLLEPFECSQPKNATVQSLSRIRASQQRRAEQRRALKEQRSKARRVPRSRGGLFVFCGAGLMGWQVGCKKGLGMEGASLWWQLWHGAERVVYNCDYIRSLAAVGELEYSCTEC